MLNIIRLTFLEISRKKIFLVTIILTALFLLLYGVTLERAAEDISKQQVFFQQIIGRQLLGLGIYFSSMLLALLALMSSAGAIASEIENGLLHAIVSRPIKRRSIVLGKFLGYGSMVCFYALLLFSGVMAINYIYNSHVLSLLTISHLIYGALLFTLQALALLSIAIVFSTVTRTLTAGIISFTLYGIGMIGGFLEQIGNMISKSGLVSLGIATSLLIPSDSLYRKTLSIITESQNNPFSAATSFPFGVAVPPSNIMVIYAGIYILACLLLSIYNFNKRDL